LVSASQKTSGHAVNEAVSEAASHKVINAALDAVNMERIRGDVDSDAAYLQNNHLTVAWGCPLMKRCLVIVGYQWACPPQDEYACRQVDFLFNSGEPGHVVPRNHLNNNRIDNIVTCHDRSSDIT
jgi:hypothetical protein